MAEVKPISYEELHQRFFGVRAGETKASSPLRAGSGLSSQSNFLRDETTHAMLWCVYVNSHVASLSIDASWLQLFGLIISAASEVYVTWDDSNRITSWVAGQKKSH